MTTDTPRAFSFLQLLLRGLMRKTCFQEVEDSASRGSHHDDRHLNCPKETQFISSMPAKVSFKLRNFPPFDSSAYSEISYPHLSLLLLSAQLVVVVHTLLFMMIVFLMMSRLLSTVHDWIEDRWPRRTLYPQRSLYERHLHIVHSYWSSSTSLINKYNSSWRDVTIGKFWL